MTIQADTRFDGVKVTKIKTDRGVLSWFIDRWDKFDIYITYSDKNKKSLLFHYQSDIQFNGIIRDFLKQ